MYSHKTKFGKVFYENDSPLSLFLYSQPLSPTKCSLACGLLAIPAANICVIFTEEVKQVAAFFFSLASECDEALKLTSCYGAARSLSDAPRNTQSTDPREKVSYKNDNQTLYNSSKNKNREIDE